jgi:Tfp pilus assembly protein PilN
MIHINLLEQRQAPAPSSAPKVTIGGFRGLLMLLIVVGGLVFVGWQWRRLDTRIGQLQRDISAADQELNELNNVLRTMDTHQAKKKTLEQRVSLISDLKRRQNVPVLLLDMLSRQVPDFLWLEGLEERSGAISVRGKATTYNAVSNFYNNLRDSSYFADVTLGTTSKAPEGVSFALSCRFLPPPQGVPGSETAPAAVGAPASGGAPASAPPRG